MAFFNLANFFFFQGQIKIGRLYSFGKRGVAEMDSYAPSSSYEMKSLIQYKSGYVKRDPGCTMYTKKILSEIATQNQQKKFIMQNGNDPVSMQSPSVLHYNNLDVKQALQKKRRGSAILEHYHQSVVNYKKQLANSVRTNYMLVLVSKWFILLHVPYFISWCLLHMQLKHFENMTAESTASEDIDAGHTRIILFKALANIFEILFALNYSINFFVYLIHGPLFRKIHSDIISRLLKCIGYLFRRPCSWSQE